MALNGSQSLVGSYGIYWSSTPDGTAFSYKLNFLSNSVDPSNSYANNRYHGYSVRCYVNGN